MATIEEENENERPEGPRNCPEQFDIASVSSVPLDHSSSHHSALVDISKRLKGADISKIKLPLSFGRQLGLKPEKSRSSFSRKTGKIKLKTWRICTKKGYPKNYPIRLVSKKSSLTYAFGAAWVSWANV